MLAVILLFAFAFQSFIAQTHIHLPDARGDSAAAAQGYSHARDKAPPAPLSQNDADKCPLCQLGIAVGAATGAGLLYWVHPVLHFAATAVSQLAAPPSAAPAYVWNSRGPPSR